jgi:hypothetical protein
MVKLDLNNESIKIIFKLFGVSSTFKIQSNYLRTYFISQFFKYHLFFKWFIGGNAALMAHSISKRFDNTEVKHIVAFGSLSFLNEIFLFQDHACWSHRSEAQVFAR